MPTKKPRIDLVIRDEFTSASLVDFSIGRKAVHLYYDGDKKNVNLDLREIVDAIGHDMHPLVFDLYKIAFAAYMADLQFPRPEKTGGRALNVLVSVSDKSKWEGQLRTLTATFRILTGDSFRFHFVQGIKAKDEYAFKKRSAKVVSLFSGGLDSLSGVKHLLDNKLDPILISHCSQNFTCNVQTALNEALTKSKAIKNRVEFHQISARVVPGRNLSQNERSQKSRSFLFLSLASIFALEKGIGEIYLFENGVLAMNLPIVSSRSYNNTKTAHPDFLDAFNSLLRTVYDCETRVENPFMYKTKTEVVHLLDCAKFRPMVKTTISCSVFQTLWRKGVKTSVIHHCGVCIPCILRRFAVFSAELSPHDARYKMDPLGDFERLPMEAKTAIMQTLDFGHRLELCASEDEVFIEIPEFYTESADPHPIIEMTRRYIAEVKTCLRKNAAAMHRDKLPYLY